MSRETSGIPSPLREKVRVRVKGLDESEALGNAGDSPSPRPSLPLGEGETHAPLHGRRGQPAAFQKRLGQQLLDQRPARLAKLLESAFVEVSQLVVV